jgi:hypothetical protein
LDFWCGVEDFTAPGLFIALYEHPLGFTLDFVVIEPNKLRTRLLRAKSWLS